LSEVGRCNELSRTQTENEKRSRGVANARCVDARRVVQGYDIVHSHAACPETPAFQINRRGKFVEAK
jgi:hypothetical protein